VEVERFDLTLFVGCVEDRIIVSPAEIIGEALFLVFFIFKENRK